MTRKTRRDATQQLRKSRLFTDWGTFRKGLEPKDLELSIANHLEYSLARDRYTATLKDLYQALALAGRDRLMERWVRTQQVHYDQDVKRVYYLSAEYLLGRALLNNLQAIGSLKSARAAVKDLGLNLSDLLEEEPDAGLGNGGLGRLAACLLDSLATLEIPAVGYGIRYEFGIFDQAIRGLQQVEQPETWLKHGNPWEICRPDRTCVVKLYGRTQPRTEADGSYRVEWLDAQEVLGVPYDIPIAGYRNDTVNTLRLWSSRAGREFDLAYFQSGDYLKAVAEKNESENISKVLYPSDNVAAGRMLRLKQEYFFVSCSIQDIVRRYLKNHDDFDAFPDKAAIQMNDTHPALAVPELMRVLVDEQGLEWQYAWDVTVATCAFTNHTLLAEALERWPVDMFGRLLPRHLEIVYEINRRFLRDVSLAFVGDQDRLRRMSIIEEGHEQKVRMAHLAIVGSHSVNGVAKLHTELLQERELKDFSEVFPDRFNAKTNGISPRRWLRGANPELAALLDDTIGTEWTRDLERLRDLEAHLEDDELVHRWRAVRRQNKENLAQISRALTGVSINPGSLFDAQVKRIHEYKRQLMNILHVIYVWLRLREEPDFLVHPRTFIMAGKAAPGYTMAKLIIRLICHVADALNKDRHTSPMLKVVFLPNYRVSLAEAIIPAADISEHISTAGYEASGTSNMKFALNGALTVGTLDGANIELEDEIGRENMFLFGFAANQVEEIRTTYNPHDLYQRDPRLKEVLDLVRTGFFSPSDPGLFQPIVDSLLGGDQYLVLADFVSYHETQMNVDKAFRDADGWTRKSMLNTARVGYFSSDRTIVEYNRDIWRAVPVPVTR